MEVSLRCTYCNFYWEENIYSTKSIEGKTCPKCKDKNLIVKELAKSKVDTYAGSPPFIKKEDDYNDGFHLDTSFPFGFNNYNDGQGD